MIHRPLKYWNPDMQRAFQLSSVVGLFAATVLGCQPGCQNRGASEPPSGTLEMEGSNASGYNPMEQASPANTDEVNWVDCVRAADAAEPMCLWLAAFDTENSVPPLTPTDGNTLQNWAAGAIATNRVCASFTVTELLSLAVRDWEDWTLAATAAVFAAAVNSADPSLTLDVADTMATWPAGADGVRLAVGDRLPLGTPMDVLIPDTETRRRIVQKVIDGASLVETPAEHVSVLGRLAWPWATAREDVEHEREAFEAAVAAGFDRWIQAGGTHAHAFVMHMHSMASLLGHVVGRDAWALTLRAVESALVADLAQTPVWSIGLELQLIHSLAQMVPHGGQAPADEETIGMALGAAQLVMVRIEAPVGPHAAALTPRWQWSGTVAGLAHALLVSPLDESAGSNVEEGLALAQERGVAETLVTWARESWTESLDALREGREPNLRPIPEMDDADTRLILHAFERALLALAMSEVPANWCNRRVDDEAFDAWLRLVVEARVDCAAATGPRELLARAAYSAGARLQMDAEVSQFCNAAVPGLSQELAVGRGIEIPSLGSALPANRTIPSSEIGGVIVWDGHLSLVPAVGAGWNPGPVGRFRMGASLRLPDAPQWRMASATEAIELLQAMLLPSPVTAGPSNVEWMIRRRGQLDLPSESLPAELQHDGYLFTGVALANARLGMLAFGARTEEVQRASLPFDGSIAQLPQIRSQRLGAGANLSSIQSMIELLTGWARTGVPLDDVMAGSRLQSVLTGLVDDGLMNEAEGTMRVFCQLVQNREGGARLCASAVGEFMSLVVPRTPDGLTLVEIAARDALLRNQPEWAAEALTRGIASSRISLGTGRYVELSLVALEASVAAERWDLVDRLGAELSIAFRWSDPTVKAVGVVFESVRDAALFVARGEIEDADLELVRVRAARAAPQLHSTSGQLLNLAWAEDQDPEARVQAVRLWLDSLFVDQDVPFWQR
jgi:hypothetical protein